jgi:hypothetical protein
LLRISFRRQIVPRGKKSTAPQTPPKDKLSKAPVITSVSMPTYTRLNELAKKRNLPLSELVRDALDKLAREQGGS